MNWMSILGLCLIVLGTVFSFFGTYYNDKQGQEELTSKIQEKNKNIDEINSNNVKLIDQNSDLLNSNSDVSNTNRDLIKQNTDMLSKVGQYQSDIEERNKKIQALESEINNVKEYSYYATLDIYGIDIIAGYGLTYTSDLSKRMGKVVEEVNGKLYVRNDKKSLPILDEVIEKYPNFPFGYFAKFNILKSFGDLAWKRYAQKAVDIFQITTTIKGHHASHDEALTLLKRDLGTNR